MQTGQPSAGPAQKAVDEYPQYPPQPNGGYQYPPQQYGQPQYHQQQQWPQYPPQQQQQQQQQQAFAYSQPAPAAAAAGGAGNGNSTVGSGSYVVRVDNPDQDTAEQFATTVVRNGFVRKVFGIVGIQLAVTVGIACLFLFNLTLKSYVRTNQWVFWMAWGLAIALLLVISCVEKARRTYPMNMMLLAAFTVVQAFLVGVISAQYNIEAVAIAFLVTSVSVICLSLFAINTKIDVTRWGTMLLVAMVAFLVLLLVGLFWVNKVLYLVLAGIACLLFSAYLIYDIQLVMGGRYYSISPDEYVFAALNIYLDIINLFIWMLALVGLAGGSNN